MRVDRKRKKGPLKRSLGWCLGLLLKIIIILILLTMAQVVLLKYIDPPFTAMMACNWIRNKVSDRPYVRPRHYWRPLKDISPRLIRAVLAGEDQRFMSHLGFDFIEMNKAFRDILTRGKVRGASTITMQVSRTVFLWPGRSLARKGLEAYYTVLLELFLTKTRILELYLNMVDWGPGVMGAEAAARRYFNRSAADLTAHQAAGLAAILPSPHEWSPVEPNNSVTERRKRIMRDMRKMHL